MMGSGSGGQKQLFYSFNLEDQVPADHLLRGIDRCLDLGELRDHLAPFYSHTGRPSIDPELMIRMLIIGYSFGIRSERRLCEEVHLNLAWNNRGQTTVFRAFFHSLHRENKLNGPATSQHRCKTQGTSTSVAKRKPLSVPYYCTHVFTQPRPRSD